VTRQIPLLAERSGSVQFRSAILRRVGDHHAEASNSAASFRSLN
jgi:hypothetical protein